MPNEDLVAFYNARARQYPSDSAVSFRKKEVPGKPRRTPIADYYDAKIAAECPVENDATNPDMDSDSDMQAWPRYKLIISASDLSRWSAVTVSDIASDVLNCFSSAKSSLPEELWPELFRRAKHLVQKELFPEILGAAGSDQERLAALLEQALALNGLDVSAEIIPSEDEIDY